MTIKKIEAGRVITQDIDQFIGTRGTIWYDEDTGEMRLHDGNPGGISLGAGGSGYILHTATITRLGGVRIGVGIDVSANGTISVNTGTPYVLALATTSTLGGVIIGAGIDISPSGVISVNTGTAYSLPVATTTTLGGIIVGKELSIDNTGTLNVDLSAIKQSIIPSQDLTYDLGSSTNKFRNIYGQDVFVTGTIYTNSIVINSTSNITIGGAEIITTATIGQYASTSTLNVLIATTSTAPSAVNGQLWFDTEDGRAYIRYDNTWVDFSPSILPPASTYLDGLTIDGTTISTVDTTSTNITIDSNLNVSGALFANTTSFVAGAEILTTATIGEFIISSTQGIQGIQGTQGIQGIQGTQGIQGITGSFTGTTAEIVHIINTTASTSTTTGALIVDGGVGIAGDIFIGGDIKDVNGSVIHIATTSTAPTRVNGQIWFNSEDGRAYIKYDGNWVDLSPTIVPPVSTYLDGLVVEGTTIRTVDTTATTVYIDKDLDVAGALFANTTSFVAGAEIITTATISRFSYLSSQGIQGTQGFIGYTGSQGVQGIQGIIGYTGSQGIQGTTGLPGQSVRITGNTSSYATLITPYLGSQWDGYITLDNGHLNVWDGAVWIDVGNVTGPQGTQGIQGLQGIQGIQGVQGIQGLQGLQGVQGIQGIQGIDGIQGIQGLIGYTGSAVIGLTSNASDTVTLSSGYKFIPETNKLQDLGDPDHRFGKLYLAGQTIFLGDTIISTDVDGGILIKKPNGDLEKIAASSLTLGSTGTDGVTLSASSGTFSITGATTKVTSIITTGTITATNIIIPGVDTSTSTTTGALIVSGGVGIGGDISVGGKLISDVVNIDGTNGVRIATSNSNITWAFNSDGTTKFPYFIFPASTGTAGQILVDLAGNGVLSWQDPPSGGGTGQAYDQVLFTTSSVTFANITIAPGGGINFPTGSPQKSRAARMVVDQDFIDAPDYDAFFATLIPGDFYWSVTYSQIKILVDYGGYYDWQDLTVYAA